MNLETLKENLFNFLKTIKNLQRNKESTFELEELNFENILKSFYLYHLKNEGYLINLKSEITEIMKIVNVDKEFQLINVSDVINYFLGELIDNVKEHSHTNEAYIFYKSNEKEILGVADFGISIPLRYKELGFDFKEPKEAIEMALEGISVKSKEERGWGLRSVVKIAKVLNGEILIVSGESISHISDLETICDNLSFFWPGTSIIIEIEKPPKNFNFLEYIK